MAYGRKEYLNIFHYYWISKMLQINMKKKNSTSVSPSRNHDPFAMQEQFSLYGRTPLSLLRGQLSHLLGDKILLTVAFFYIRPGWITIPVLWVCSSMACLSVQQTDRVAPWLILQVTVGKQRRLTQCPLEAVVVVEWLW